jgi:Protein of unknown function (DUF3987)
VTLSDATPSVQTLLDQLSDVKTDGKGVYWADCPAVTEKDLPHPFSFQQNGRGAEVRCWANHTDEQVWEGLAPDNTPAVRRTGEEKWIPFPAHAIPKSLLKLAEEASVAGGYPAEFVIIPGLSVLAGAMGKTYSISLGTTWPERAVLWTGVVAHSGAGKSPALDLVMEPIHYFDSDRSEEWTAEHKAWDPKGEEPEPILRRTFCSDVTMESLVEILAENPRGMVREVDEVASVVSGLNQYKGGKGNDRTQLLTLWHGSIITRDRIRNKAPVIVKQPNCSITGGIQPSRVAEFLQGGDGLAERWLLGFFTGVEVQPAGEDVNPITVENWRALIFKLLNLEYRSEDGSTLCFLTPEAKQLWNEFWDKNRVRHNQTTNTQMKSYWSKLNRHAGRIACLLHVVESIDAGQLPGKEVQRETMEHAIHISEWFAHQFEENLPAQENKMLPRNMRDMDDAVQDLHQKLLLEESRTFTIRQIQRKRIGGVQTSAEAQALATRYNETYPESFQGKTVTVISESPVTT